MKDKEKIGILQTALLIINGVSDADLILKHDLGQYVRKAREVVTILSR